MNSFDDIKKIVQNELNRVESLLCDINSDFFDLNNSLKTLLMAPSKRLRPLISFLYIKALNKEIDENQIQLQAAIELIHSATLIHDDIIDKSDVRRSVSTLNAKFDNSLAVVAGDYLLSIALKMILALKNSKLLEIFSLAIENMCLGEISQYFSLYKMPTIEEYIEKSAKKTASLFEASLVSSAILGDFNEELAEKFARNFGIAFQIRDDILNYTTLIDKPVKNDYENGIYTAPVIFAGDINNISKGIEKSSALLDNYLSEAKNVISSFEDSVYKNALVEILDLLKTWN